MKLAREHRARGVQGAAAGEAWVLEGAWRSILLKTISDHIGAGDPLQHCPVC
jgi:hypothetical protein